MITERVKREIRKFLAFSLAVIMVISSFVEVAYASSGGVSVGSTGTLDPRGAFSSQAGGIGHIDDPIFKVGIMRDPAFYHNGSKETSREIITNWSHRFPENKDSIFMTPYGKKNEYTSGNMKVGIYNPSNRTIGLYTDSVSLSRIHHLNQDGTTKPKFVVKENLSGYSATGRNGLPSFAKLANGKWKEIAMKSTLENANNIWSWILSPKGTSIQDRMNEMISPHAHKDNLHEEPIEVQEDVHKGYLALLMTTWRLVPAKLKGPWEEAIEDFLVMRDIGKGQRPVAIVVEAAVMVKQNIDNSRIVMSVVDYFMYYTAVGSKWSIHRQTPQSIAGAKGETYDMLKHIVNKDISENRNITRISRQYNPNNAFSHGAGALAYPDRRFSTAGGIGEWQPTNLATSIIDYVTLGTSSGTRKIRGFSITSFTLKDIVTVGVDGDASVEFEALPDNKLLVPAGSEIIGEPVELIFSSKPTEEIINSWKRIFDDDPNINRTINIKLDIDRTASPSAHLPPSYFSQDGNFITGVDVSREDFMAFIRGEKSIKMIDNTVNEPITQRETKVYTYKPKMTITYKSGVETKKIELDLGSDTASFIRPADPPEYIGFTSGTPKTYAEFKEGRPDNEKFEAMAGVPSTERLYLGVGGNEFVVDVELEYVQNVDSKWRTYRSIFTGVASEFKAGDTAPNQTIGGQSANLHGGGTYSKTWSGSIPNDGESVTALHNATSVAVPNYESYDSDYAEAEKFRDEVNATIVSHMSASDKVLRQHSGWGAEISAVKNDPVDSHASVSCNYVAPTPPDEDGNGGDPGKPCENEMATANPSGPGSYTITVTWTVPAHIVCGPECTNDMPDVEDTWKQRINFDYMKINRVEVYKIEEGRIVNVDNVFGEGKGELKAKIREGDPNIFYNIADQNANGNDAEAQSSKHGRLRYTLDWDWHDSVVYEEGPRSNKSDGMGDNGTSYSPAPNGHNHSWAKGILYTNPNYTDEYDFHMPSVGTKSGYSDKVDDIDAQTMEWQRFDQRRRQPNQVFVISDMLILQTSSGDQSVIYFEKGSEVVEAQEQFPDMRVTKEEMWDNNPYSAANWNSQHINIGSYNGNYDETGTGSSNNKKYWGFHYPTGQFIENSGSTQKPVVGTRFDNNGAGVNASRTRPTRPHKMYMYQDRGIENTTKNGAYTNGGAEVFYEKIFEYNAKNTYKDTSFQGTYLRDDAFTSKKQSAFSNKDGLVYDAVYSDDHKKVNDIIIHTPVSVQDAIIISEHESKDQRINKPPGGAEALIEEQNLLKICPLDPATCEFRVLNCKYRHDVELASFDFENIIGNTILNKTTGAYIPFEASDGITFGTQSGFGQGNVLKAFGTRFSIDFDSIGLSNTKNTTVMVEFDLYKPTDHTGMLVSFYEYDFMARSDGLSYFGTGNGTERVAEGLDLRNKKVRIGLQFSFGSPLDNKVFIDGVEHTNWVQERPHFDLSGRIGTKLNIGSWGLNDKFPANVYIDNLKIIRKGGTLEHTEACYIVTESHEMRWTHVHTDECFVGGDPIERVFHYTGSEQTFTAPHTGEYTLEVWGAQGGDSSHGLGGKGGYAKGVITLEKGDTLYIYVGQEGVRGGSGNRSSFNGGASPNTNHQFTAGGGGATDIRLIGGSWNNSNGLNSRIIVAGGGGGAGAEWGYERGGAGGGLTGQSAYWTGPNSASTYGRGGTQTSAGGPASGGFGYGGRSTTPQSGSGGGGWYGGGGQTNAPDAGGGGGSGYVLTSSSYKPSGYSVSTKYYLSNTQLIRGDQSMPSPSGGTQVGHSGNGVAKITSEGGRGVETICNNLPLNYLSQNNVHVHDENCINEHLLEDMSGTGDGRVVIKTKTYRGSVSDFEPFEMHNLFGKGYSYSGSSYSVVLPYTLRVGDRAVIYTANGNDSTNNSFRPTLPSDFTPVGSASNGRQVYTKIIQQSDLGRTISIDGGSTWGYVFFTVPSKYEIDVVNTSGSTINYNGLGKDIAIVSILHSILNINGYTSFNTSYNSFNMYYSTFPSSKSTTFPVPQGTTFHNTNYPHIVFVDNGFEEDKYEYYETSNYSYTGGIQTFTASEDGTYLLETWGAQGGYGSDTSTPNLSWNAGKGGYSRGVVDLKRGETVYVVVGGAGGGQSGQTFSPNTEIPGGYNGGGKAHRDSYEFGGGGGGATHIAKRSGLLSSLNSYRSDILIVAGGGGGTGEDNESGGHGGGLSSPATYSASYSATQTNAGTRGSFGQGASYLNSNESGGGGGGGYYGGGGGEGGGSGGGSSYIGGVRDGQTISGDQNMPSPSGGLQLGHSGNGYAKITRVKEKGVTGSYEWEDVLGPNWEDYIKDEEGAITEGQTRVFKNTSTGRTGSNIDNSSGTLGGQVTMSNGMYHWTVPETGRYQIEVWGAQGGDTESSSWSSVGGKGARMRGDFELYKGETIIILVGQAGGQYVHGGGGGGASYVARGLNRSTATPLIVAAGGGGASASSSGGSGLSSIGTDTNAPYSGGSYPGGAGGGFTYTGTTGYGAGGASFRNGGAGGEAHANASNGWGGFGGGGGNGWHGGGGGGGYQGGRNGDTDHVGGLGGYSYNSGVNQSNSSGVRTGHGEVKITSLTTVKGETTIDWDKIKADVAKGVFPDYLPDGEINPLFKGDAFTFNQHVHNENCKVVRTLACTEPHHFGLHYDNSNPICWDACGDDSNHQQLKDEVETEDGTLLKSGTFVNLDAPFRVYFPNTGDFNQQINLQGISELTTIRGKGYVQNMDTTKYTKYKRIQFDYAVIYDGVLYPSGAWIDLPVNQSYYEFYTVLGNKEAHGAGVRFEVIPINGRPLDYPMNENYESSTNRERLTDYYSLHGAYKETYVDVVGRIGNFTVTDTDDFRTSEFFKKAKVPTEWLIEGIVKKVASNMQNFYYGDQVDIRGEKVQDTGVGLNTYGTQPWLEEKPYRLPVNPKDSPNSVLKNQFLKIGYDILAEIQTTGNYADGVVRALPYYYKLNTSNGTLTPLDVYIETSDGFKPVNLYRGAEDGNLPDNLYEYELILDWENESIRRNYTIDEDYITNYISELYEEPILGMVDVDGTVEEGVTGVKRYTIPSGNYVPLGNSQRIVLDNRARTFIGTTRTYGENKNPNDVLSESDYYYQAHRWMMKFGLPSSVVFVESGMSVTQENIDAIKQGEGVILLAVDVIAIGELYTLRWHRPENNTININDKVFNLTSSGIPPVIALLDLETTSVIDVNIRGSH